MKIELRDLLNTIAQGDIDALGALYEEVSHQLFNYIRTIIPCRETAEDILHDVFLQINANAARISTAKEPMAYIMRIARNHAYNILKREKKIATGSAVDDLSNDVFSQLDLKLDFEQAYNSLPQNQREAVYLRLYCGFTHNEIAEIQRAPVVTVKWRYRQAVTKLKEILSEREVIDYVADRISPL